MIHPIAKRFLPIALCLTVAVVVGCAGVPKAVKTAHDDQTERKERKRELVRDYEQRRNGVQYQAALALVQEGDTDGALKALTRLLERVPNHRPSVLLAGEVAIELDHPAIAVDFAKQLVELDSKDAEAHHLLGLALEAQGNLAEAKLQYEKAVELAPENEGFAASLTVANSADLQIASTSHRTARIQRASHDDRADSAEAAVNSALETGHRALAASDIQESQRQYAAAMASEPDNPNIPLEAALQLIQHNQAGAAVSLLNDACRTFPQSVPLLRTLATAQYRQGDYEFSQVALQQALSLDNRDALSYFLMGAVREKLGDHKGAELSKAKAQELRQTDSAHR
jgi:Flp pilus assembly protein TadD